MTDISNSPAPAAGWTTPEASARLRRRRRAETRLKLVGMGAIGFAFLMLAVLIGSLTLSGWHAFTQSHARITVTLAPEYINTDDLRRSDFRGLLRATMAERLGEGEAAAAELRRMGAILSNGAQSALRERLVANPALAGQTLTLRVPLADPYDQLNKGLIDRDTPENIRRLSDREIGWFDTLKAEGAISRPLNFGLLTNADSRFPELAGLRGALVGSLYALLTCFLLSFPIGIGAAIWLEEFAPKNRMSDLIEVNINNLAAVPSVVFGLLALAVFLGWFGMPRSAPFVGGMTLALMTLPTIIIATRAALKAVPPSIREAAMGLGASKQQVVFQHVLPLAMPGILTGTIIGLAQALGETAPLLLIGMNAFVTAAPATPFDPSTALPTQIFIWADSPERGFVSRTSAAILVLLGFLIAMNALAIFLRSKFERKW